MSTLIGKTAIVTGANSGMGMATAAALADMGAVVVMESFGRSIPAKIQFKPTNPILKTFTRRGIATSFYNARKILNQVES